MLKVSKNRVKVVEVNGEKVSPPTDQNRDKQIPNRLAAQIPPKPEEVLSFFSEQNSTETEANKFYNYFQSNG